MYREMKMTMIGLVTLVFFVGCAQLPGDRTTQTSVGGAVAGAAAGSILAENEVLGAVLGSVVGAATGYVIGAKTDWFDEGHKRKFDRTLSESLNEPATVEDVYGSDDADLNDDGLVTQDELVALARSGIGTDEIMDRLEDTEQVFHVTEAQRQNLLDAGVPPEVVYNLEDINRS